MLKIQVIPAAEQAHQVLRVTKNPEKTQEEGSIYGSSFGYLSWAYVTEDLYFPAHRKGAMDCYIYVLNQGHLNGDHIDEYSHVLEGDMVIMQSGATNAPQVKRIAPDFRAFEFWFTEEGLLKGFEKPDFLKIRATQFPMKIENDVVVRQLFGENAPVSHINGMTITELIVPPLAKYTYKLFANRKLGMYVVRGDGNIGNKVYVKGDFVEAVQIDDPVDGIIIHGGGELTSRLILIDIESLNQ